MAIVRSSAIGYEPTTLVASRQGLCDHNREPLTGLVRATGGGIRVARNHLRWLGSPERAPAGIELISSRTGRRRRPSEGCVLRDRRAAPWRRPRVCRRG